MVAVDCKSAHPDGRGGSDLYLHGAQLTHWAGNSRPVIFLSEHSLFEKGKAIRGGVPVCFHGSVRARRAGAWVRPQSRMAFGIDRKCPAARCVWISDASDAGTLAIWPYAYEARLIYTIGAELQMTLEARNVSGGIVHVF